MVQPFYTKTFSLIFLLTLGFCDLSAQEIILSQKLEELSRQQLTSLTGFPALNGVVVYKVNYLTTGSDTKPDTASGLVVLPDDTTITSMVAYQHGTTDGPRDVPSNNNSEALLVKALAGQGYLATAADYLGLGDSRGFHPYVHAATEASAGIDLLMAGRTLASGEGFGAMEQIFVTGYSQGGHAAMAMAQAIQERDTDDLWVTAAAPMSGPYSISTVMRSVSVLDTTAYFYPAYVVYFVLGYQEVYGDLYESIDQVFKPQYLSMIDSFYQDKIGLSALNEFLIAGLTDSAGKSIPSALFTETYLQAISSDSLHPANVALRDNDTYWWVPQFPMRLFYCTADDQVNFQNSLVASEYMNDQGAPDVQAIDVFPSADHGACVLPAVLSTLAFFNSFTVPTSTSENRNYQTLRVFPNPADRHLNLDISGDIQTMDMFIYNQLGVLVKQQNNFSDHIISVESLPDGIYHLTLQRQNQRWRSTFIIQR